MTENNDLLLQEVLNEIKLDTGDLREQVTNLEESVIRLEGQVLSVETNTTMMEKRTERIVNLLPDLTQKLGELKNWRQIAFLILAVIMGLFLSPLLLADRYIPFRGF